MNKEQIKKVGDILTVAIPIFMSGYLLIYESCKSLITFLLVYIVGNLLCQIIKGICDTDRPREGGEYETIKIHGYSHNDGESCCSGHAMSAALPAYFALLWVDIWLFISLFIFSSVCAWTRVKVKAHWTFDVVLSNIIALVVNIVVAYIVKLYIWG